MRRAPRSSGPCSRKTDKALAWRNLSTPYNVWLQLVYKTVHHYFLMLSKRKITSRDILQGTSPGARRAFRKSAKKWDGDLEGGKGFPGEAKILASEAAAELARLIEG